VSIGSIDTVIGNNLIVNGSIRDSTGAAYGIGGPITKFCTKYVQVQAQTIPTNTWTVVKNFANVFTLGSGMVYSTDGMYTNVSSKTLTISISYTLGGYGISGISGISETRIAKLRVYNERGVVSQQAAMDTRPVIAVAAPSIPSTILLQASSSPILLQADSSETTILLRAAQTTNTNPKTDTILLQANATPILLQADSGESTILLQASNPTTSLIQTTTNTILLQANSSPILLQADSGETTILLQAYNTSSIADMGMENNETTTLAGSTFLHLFPNHKFALWGYATSTYNTKESTVCIAELG
jgi:hypothetical protein